MRLEVGTVIIVDDDPSVRASLRRLVRTAGHAVRAYSNVEQLAHDGRPEGPCCLVLGLDLPRQAGAGYRQTLDAAHVRLPAIIITGTRDVATVVRVMKSGAFDLLTKPLDVDGLLAAIETALAADERKLEIERRLAGLRCRFETLTARERDVFFAVTRGLLNKQVAIELGVSEKTVKVHRARVTAKLAADSVAALVRMADHIQRDDHPLEWTPWSPPLSEHSGRVAAV